ncbi:MAG: hypothetical protein ACK40G_01880 [Cytophagaceae bacterium]
MTTTIFISLPFVSPDKLNKDVQTINFAKFSLEKEQLTTINEDYKSISIHIKINSIESAKAFDDPLKSFDLIMN